MAHLVIGTAGHVDHGKTALIRALTGEETDRLPEEKARGISIDIGFAQFVLPSGRRAAVVDVPGHERFIRNMLAGATGIDLVLLVVAADEGVMPQTREHLNILRLLEVKKGLVALTKSDLVDAEWIDLVRDDLARALTGTFLEGAPILPVSSVTGEGLDELRRTLDRLLPEVESKDPLSFTRLPIDRSFIRPGFGPVVTGTLAGGTIRIGDRLEILPLGEEVRVRGLQVHGEKVERAEAGQRVAVNLVGIEREDIERGHVLCQPGALTPSDVLAGRLHLLPDWPKPFETGTRVHLHTGTAEILARVALLDRDHLNTGQSAYVQIRCEQPLVVGRGDHFILRSYSPVHTLGGGVVLEPHARYKRFSGPALAELESKEKGGRGDLVAGALSKSGPFPLTQAELARQTGIPTEALGSELEDLRQKGEIVALEGGCYLHARGHRALVKALEDHLREFHRQHPLRLGFPREELRRRILPKVDTKLWNTLLALMAGQGVIGLDRDKVAMAGHTVTLTAEQQRIAASLENAFLSGGFSPPTMSEAITRLNWPQGEAPGQVHVHGQASGQAHVQAQVRARTPVPAQVRTHALTQTQARVEDVLGYLVESGIIIRLAEDVAFHRQVFEDAWSRVKAALLEKGRLTVADVRDLLGTSRKFTLPLLEYLDEIKHTRRVGDERVLGSAG